MYIALVVFLQLKARILYIDPVSKTVGLTLNPELLDNVAPAMVLLLMIRTLSTFLTSLIFFLLPWSISSDSLYVGACFMRCLLFI
jgi:hypothetical protein